MKLPKDDWTLLGSTLNCDAYQLRDDLIAMVPHPDVRETLITARANLEFQRRHWEKSRHGGASIIFMDPIVAQDADARGVYANESGDIGTLCYALIGATFFARATSTVYTGLARPTVPIEVFPSLEEALPWIDKTIATLKS